MRYTEINKVFAEEEVSSQRLNEEVASYSLCRSSQVLWVVDRDYKIVHLSSNYKDPEDLGFDRERLLGSNVLDRFSGDERAFVEEVMIITGQNRASDQMGGLSRRLTFFMDHPDGQSNIPLDVFFAPFIDDEGTLRGFVGGVSIPDNEMEKPEVGGSVELEAIDPENVVDQYLSGVLFIDKELKIRHVNKLFTHITGYAKEEALGQRMDMLWGDRHISFPLLKRFCMGGQAARDGEIWLQHKRGHLLKLRFSGHRFINKKSPGEQLLAFCFLDITDVEKSLRQKDILYRISQTLNKEEPLNELLKEVHRHLSVIMKVDNLMIAFYDKESQRFTLPYMVDAFDHYSSFPSANTMSNVVIQQKRSYFLHQKEIKEFVEQGSVVVQGGVPSVWIGVPMIVHGEAIGVIVAQDYDADPGLTRDDLSMLEFLSEQVAMVVYRKNTDEQLREDVELKNRIFSIIAHDLRAPFHSLISLTSLLEEDEDLSPEEQKEVFTSLHETSRNGYNLLENLLLWARAREGKHDQFRETLNLRNLVDEVLFFQKHGADFKGIALENNVSNSLIITSDINKLKTILRNLVSNAVKYSFQGGKVVITARTRPGKLEVYVADDGVGIEEEQMKQLFISSRDFTRPGTDNEKGAGLGLHLCKDFVRQLGGEIHVKSEKEKGCTFWFSIPLKNQLSDAVNISITKTAEDEKGRLKGKTILVAEDMDINYVLLNKMLEKMGARVLRANNGQEAVELCQKENPQAIFMDINMPVMNGIQATRIITKEYPHIPVIIQTAYASELNMNESKKAGAQYYMEKPLNKKAVDKVINKIFDSG